jgi:hypothetical protein
MFGKDGMDRMDRMNDMNDMNDMDRMDGMDVPGGKEGWGGVRRIGAKFGLLGAGALLGGALVMGVPAFAAGPGSTAASTPTPRATSAPSKYCQAYEQTLASKLQVSQSDLESANQAAIQAALQQAVADGTLTQAQADAMVKRLTSNGAHLCPGFGRAATGPNQGAAGKIRQAVVAAVASKLGMNATTLQQQIAGGQTIVALAGQHQLSQSDLNTLILATVKSQLDSAVSAQTITSAQEQTMLDRITKQVNAGQYGAIGLAAHKRGAAPTATPSASSSSATPGADSGTGVASGPGSAVASSSDTSATDSGVVESSGVASDADGGNG